MNSPQSTFVMLLAIPFVFWALGKYGTVKGLLVATIGGMMFLPEQAFLKLPLLPEFTKHRIVMIGLWLALAVGKLRPRAARPEWWWWILFVGCFLMGVLAWQTNTEPLYYGPLRISGLNFKDGMYISLSAMCGSVGLVYMGMRTFRTEQDLDQWLRVLAGAGLIYSIFCVIEMRFTPQTHRWIYGYHAHDMFSQSYRFGGYRPNVFMAHGLATSLFMLGTAMAATVLLRNKQKVWKWKAGWPTLWLILVVIACRSTGVWIYGLIGLPMARWMSAKTMLRTALVIMVIVVAYPYMRITHTFPTETVLEYAAKIQEDRMLSLKFRFDNEEVLVAHALRKPWFGWSGNYGRNRLYDDGGGETTVTDGGWIIAFGDAGTLGLILSMGAPVFAIVAMYRRVPKVKDPRVRNALAALTLYLAFMLLDVIPNAAFNWLQWLVAGALCGMTSGILASQRVKKPAKPQPATARTEPPPPRETGRPEPIPA